MGFSVRYAATTLSRASRPRALSTAQTSWNKINSATSAKENERTPGLGESETTLDPSQKVKKKTIAELDEELRLKMEGRSGDGGTAGVEYENGKAEGSKRGVKDNMFRVI